MGDGLGNSFDVFFSYHWRDHAPVEAVARTLTERGMGFCFLACRSRSTKELDFSLL